MSGPAQAPVLSCDMLLAAYARGWFPMGHEDGALYWHDPDPRAIFPLEDLSPGRTSRRLLQRSPFRTTRDQAFTEVMRGCADRPETWITEEMIIAYTALHELGHAHSVEVWKEGALVGGIYGVHLGSAFFGESMFGRESNASRIAFLTLLEHLQHRGFHLFDSQYLNAHTALLGAVEIPRGAFRLELASALQRECRF